MIQKGIINIPDSEKIQVTGSGDPVIPDWVKNNSRWWSEDRITEQDFVLGLEWLIKEGIIRV